MPEEATFLSEPARQLSSLDAVRGLAWACARWALATHPHGFPPFRLPLAPRTHQRRRSAAFAHSDQTARLRSVERHRRMIACSGLHRLVLIASHTTPPLSRRVAVPCTRGASGGCDRRTRRPRAQLGSLYSASSAPPLAASRSARPCAHHRPRTRGGLRRVWCRSAALCFGVRRQRLCGASTATACFRPRSTTKPSQMSGRPTPPPTSRPSRSRRRISAAHRGTAW